MLSRALDVQVLVAPCSASKIYVPGKDYEVRALRSQTKKDAERRAKGLEAKELQIMHDGLKLFDNWEGRANNKDGSAKFGEEFSALLRYANAVIGSQSYHTRGIRPSVWPVSL